MVGKGKGEQQQKEKTDEKLTNNNKKDERKQKEWLRGRVMVNGMKRRRGNECKEDVWSEERWKDVNCGVVWMEE